MIKHDMKKIEELLNESFRDNEKGYTTFDLAMKQYAEHMVQQERERVLDFIKKDRKEPTPEDWYEAADGYSYLATSIINLINKEDE